MSIKAGLPEAPTRIRKLPLDHRGYPVPWFVDWMGGKPVFQAMDPAKFARAVKQKRCWVCGEPLGRFMTFVIGPMCTVTRTTSEPPSHRDCATWSARACPFLTRPRMARNAAAVADLGVKSAAGLMIDRNPGVCCLWTTKSYRIWRSGRDRGATDGWLITVGDPVEVEWYAEGRAATRAEVEASIVSGTPILEELARLDGQDGLDELHRKIMDVGRLMPAEAAQ